MIPYATFLYFALTGLYVLVPVLLLRFAKAVTTVFLKRACIVVSSIVMLALQYYPPFDAKAGPGLRQIYIILCFLLFQYAVAAWLLFWRSRTRSRWPGHLAVAVSVTPLLLAKLSPAFSGGSASLACVEFIGLSYATLKAVDVLIGIHDGLLKELPPTRYLAFLVFFPTISSGPIDRYRRFSEDWSKGSTRLGAADDLDNAIHRLLTGFFYKFVLAYLINKHWLERIPADPAPGHTASYMYGYSLYLFFDFAGYSSFAVAFSLIFGIRTPENFNRPFLSRNIKEFWTRWHISLSTWFRDFIYMRFLLTAFKKKWFQDKRRAAYAANFVTFGAMGFWHGTQTHYLVYGLYHACLITGHDIFANWNRPRPDAPARIWGTSLPWQVAGILLTSHAAAFGFLIFSGRRLW